MTTHHRLDALLTDIAGAPDAHTLFAATSARLRGLSSFDAAVWAATDPINGLTTAPVRVENLHEGGCGTYWEAELFGESVNRFRDLAQAPVPVVGLRAVTGGDPACSPLYRTFMRPRGFADELRAVFRVDGQSWGQLSLFRERGRADFDAADIAHVTALSAPLAHRLRSFARPSSAPMPRDTTAAPGMLLFDDAGNLVSLNDEARSLLAQMPPGPSTTTALGLALPLPVWILSTAGRARLTGGSARIRIRTGTGRWLICHASCLRAAEGGASSTALIIEPAKPSEIAGLLTAAYELTPREIEVVDLIARGLPTAEIAATLHLSAHTVRDHVKAVFDKVGVTSRGELVACLFTEFQQPVTARDTVRVVR
ncbi:helix-turn-helix transcriptional regulator [Nocardia sp. NPDC050435]|uniref:helix-turn-helix transcriptional regulator n=1 Tax=Nocardia sp. NPDC050435 TaxID=3155040 RepID=UPI0033DAD04C